MKVRHYGKKTELVETDQAHGLGLPMAVISSARRKIRLLREATDQRDIRMMKSFRLEKLKGDRAGQHSIRINDQWRMILLFDTSGEQQEIVILAIEDYH